MKSDLCTLSGLICDRRSVSVKPTALKFRSLDKFVAGIEKIFMANFEILGNSTWFCTEIQRDFWSKWRCRIFIYFFSGLHWLVWVSSEKNERVDDFSCDVLIGISVSLSYFLMSLIISSFKFCKSSNKISVFFTAGVRNVAILW